MAILCDDDIRKLCVGDGWKAWKEMTGPAIEPYSEAVDGGGVISYGGTHGGYDIRLGRTVLVYKNTYGEIVSPKRMKQDKKYQARIFDVLQDLDDHHPVLVPPVPFYVLGYSLEYLRVPPVYKAHFLGKSSLARCGITVNITPGEPGWEGHLTIEIYNTSPCQAEIYVAEGIVQMEFHELTRRPSVLYGEKGGKYQFQKPEPVPAMVKE